MSLWKRSSIVVGFAAGTLLLASAAQAQVVFSDNFNAQNGGAVQLNFAAFTQWTVSDGTVDLIGNGSFDLYPGNGLYVDMDGSTGNAGILTSSALALPAGNYTLSFSLGKNGGGTEVMNVLVGSEFTTTLTDTGSYPAFVPQIFNFTIASDTSGSIVFDHGGDDNGGYVIDNVQLVRATVPEPGTVSLLAMGLVGALVLRRRKPTTI